MDYNPHYRVVLVCGILDENQQVDSQSLHYYIFNKIPFTIVGYNSNSIQNVCRSPVGKPADFKHLKVLNGKTKIMHISNIARHQMGAKYCLKILAASKDNANILHFFNGNEEQLTPTNQLNRHKDVSISPHHQIIGCKRLRSRNSAVALVFSFFCDTNAVVVNAQHTDDSVFNHISEIAQSWKLQWLNKLEVNDDNLMHRFECPLLSKTRSDSSDFSLLDWPLSNNGPVQAGCDLRNAFNEETDTATAAMQLNAFVRTQLASGEIHDPPSEWLSPIGSESLLMGGGFDHFAGGLDAGSNDSLDSQHQPLESAATAMAYTPFAFYATPSASGGSDESSLCDDFIDAFTAESTNDPLRLREHYYDVIKDRCDDSFVMVKVHDMRTLLSNVNV